MSKFIALAIMAGCFAFSGVSAEKVIDMKKIEEKQAEEKKHEFDSFIDHSQKEEEEIKQEEKEAKKDEFEPVGEE